MGLTKQYLRYVPAGNFNIIASVNCNVCFVVLDGQEGRFVAVGGCEHIIIWDLRIGEKAQVLSGEKTPVTYIASSPSKRHIAGGYSDGNIQIYDLQTGEIASIFAGHQSEVTCMVYDSFGHKLASGSKDTDIIVWDTVAETGICRLSGHRKPITQLAFMSNEPYLISASKDTFIKFWDLDTEHCFKTIVAHRSEVWSICLMKDDRYLISASGDAELRVWKLFNHETQEEATIDAISQELQTASLEDSENESGYSLRCIKAGSLLRSGRGRVVSMFSDITGQIIACHGTDDQIELFHFLPEEELKDRMKKRLKKERKKNENTLELSEQVPTLRDEVKRLTPLKLSKKPKSFHLVLGNGGELRTCVILANNSLEMFSLKTLQKDAEHRSLRRIVMHGHQGEVRAVAFSSDNLAIITGGNETVKMWNRPSQISLRTIDSGYVLCILFVPGDRHAVVGLKDGRLLIMDVAAGDILEEVNAHGTELWSMCLMPDLKGIVTGGGDNTVKFWQFELVADEKLQSKAKVLSVLHTRTLKLEESVLCVRLSADAKFLAVALLDSTVKIFFVDTFKFYLSLYGHKLPVLCMDISSDSTLIATGSADRNVKIWGMDFGDCHRSIFAHDDSVTDLQFVPRTHYFFTCGKDGKIKEWDGDNFKKIMTIQGHIGEAWNLAISPNGQFVVSCGSDRVLRMYERSDQTLVLQDEEEQDREEQAELATGDQTVIPGQPGRKLPSKKTMGSENAAESILECLAVCEEYKKQLADHGESSKPPAPLLMQAFKVNTNEDFVLETLKRIRPRDMEEALLILPFSSVCDLFEYLPKLMERGDYIELVHRVVMFLLKIHHAPIVANHALLATLESIQWIAKTKIEELRDIVGYNYFGMQYLQREIESHDGIQLFRDATTKSRKRGNKRKQREAIKRSILQIS